MKPVEEIVFVEIACRSTSNSSSLSVKEKTSSFNMESLQGFAGILWKSERTETNLNHRSKGGDEIPSKNDKKTGSRQNKRSL